ncbi:MAG: hypothetical protein ORN57_03245 [Alphaproteobacteria bacterium]|nr:hypothetical protein [Alphaproteobacteria bacterium]
MSDPKEKKSLEQPAAKEQRGDTPPAKKDDKEFITLLNVSYDTREDRLTLKVATNQSREFRFWITQRLYRKMSEMFENIERQVLINPQVPMTDQAAAREFQKHETLSRQNFSVGYPKDEELVKIFGEEPLLIDKIEAVFNNDFVQFTISSSEMQATLPLHQETVTALRHLLDSAADKGEWLTHSENKLRLEKRTLN